MAERVMKRGGGWAGAGPCGVGEYLLWYVLWQYARWKKSEQDKPDAFAIHHGRNRDKLLVVLIF
jgi:hypothetical protein